MIKMRCCEGRILTRTPFPPQLDVFKTFEHLLQATRVVPTSQKADDKLAFTCALFRSRRIDMTPQIQTKLLTFATHSDFFPSFRSRFPISQSTPPICK